MAYLGGAKLCQESGERVIVTSRTQPLHGIQRLAVLAPQRGVRRVGIHSLTQHRRGRSVRLISGGNHVQRTDVIHEPIGGKPIRATVRAEPNLTIEHPHKPGNRLIGTRHHHSLLGLASARPVSASANACCLPAERRELHDVQIARRLSRSSRAPPSANGMR